MLIYHITKQRLQITSVILGAGASTVSTTEKCIDDVPLEHLEGVKQLRSGGVVFVTGGSYEGSIYSGKFEDRASFKHYIEN